ncbi:reverse transcriptase/maturase%2C group FT II introns [Streptococcus pseudopneumoniae]|nr:reverse transcriptase/maturase%2C group FT II introns [Streptococcus pseudopneumoniae]
MLNELDKELEKRGLRFVRYADDCVITVGSEAAAKRVMYSVSYFIEKRLGLKVNITKTKITRPRELKYLGFGFWKSSDGWKSRPHQDSVRRFKLKLKKLTQRKWSIDLTRRIEQLILFENQIQTTSTSPCRTQVQPAASFLVCSLIFIEYEFVYSRMDKLFLIGKYEKYCHQHR